VGVRAARVFLVRRKNLRVVRRLLARLVVHACTPGTVSGVTAIDEGVLLLLALLGPAI